MCFLLFVYSFNAKAKEDNITVCINEIMQSNVNTLMIEKDFPDSWIELYNATDDSISLKNWRIGETKDFVSSYRLKDECYIAPHNYLIICCDQKNYSIHTNFRLESTNKGNIYLFNSLKEVVDSLHYKKMKAIDVAYGRITDGGDEWGHETEATPGCQNNGKFSTIELPSPVFEPCGGIFEAPLHLTISKPESEELPEDAKLYVTLDGSEPTSSSFSCSQFAIDLQTTTIVRAKYISDLSLFSPSITHSYIIDSIQSQIPIVSIATNNEFLYSDSIGILYGTDTDEIINYKQDWRRPVNVEYFDVNSDTACFNQLAEVEVGGQKSRDYLQKSLKVYANKRFGNKRFDYPLWADKENVQNTKSFVLRNGGNNCFTTKINDAFIQRLIGTNVTDVDWQAYSPCIVYLNGEYNGLYELRERANDDYVEANYQCEDAEMIDQRAYYTDIYKNYEIFKFVYSDSLATFNEILEYVNVKNFMNNLIIECFSSNNDYPHNNISIWRHEDYGNKWNWILKDLDRLCWMDIDHNMFHYMFDDDANDFGLSPSVFYDTHLLYKRMLSFTVFKDMFINHYCTYLGDFLRPSVSTQMLQEMASQIDKEMISTLNLYNQNVDNWSSHLNKLKTFCMDRPKAVYQQIGEFFDLGKPILLSIGTDGNKIEMNGVELRNDIFDGYWLSNHSLEVSMQTGYSYFTIHYYHNDELLKSQSVYGHSVNVDLSSFPDECKVGECEDSISINVQFDPTNVRNTLYQDPYKIVGVKKVFGLDGIEREEMKSGFNILIDKYGNRRKCIIHNKD